MISSATLKNFGPLEDIMWDDLAAINLVIGKNGKGKTFLLKALYAAIKSIEQNYRGDDNKNLSEILSDKFYWTFQAEKIGDIVRKPGKGQLEFSMAGNGHKLYFSFGQDTTKKIMIKSGDDWKEPNTNSIFIPAKEVISLQKIILKSREQDSVFGFDDTYYDLAKALRIETTKEKNILAFAQSRQKLKDFLGGKVEFDPEKDRWTFKKGSVRFPIGTTSEGTKKAAILDTLLGNRYLSQDSRIFIDEPEAALHPNAVNELIDIITILAECGIQFFIATHSYFVIKKLLIVALKNKLSIPVLSLSDDGVRYENLRNGMPQNSIIDESVRLYEEEVGVALKWD